MTASALIASMATDTITIKRPAVGTYNIFGEYVEGSVTTITAQAVVYPLQGDDLLKLPEGLRTQETVKIICAVELKAGNDETNNLRKPDIITINSLDYEVYRSMQWKGLGFILAWEAIAVRLSV